jgi:integral membrane sensor domain MASE1
LVRFRHAGAVIGPVCLTVLGFILQLRGGNEHTIWQGDGIGLGLVGCLPLALIVGLLTAAIYTVSLKVIHGRPAA